MFLYKLSFIKYLLFIVSEFVLASYFLFDIICLFIKKLFDYGLHLLYNIRHIEEAFLMSKKRSKIKFTILALVAALGIFLTCFSFRIPFTTTTWKGFANAISMGLDIKGGVLAVYEANVDDEYQSEFETRIGKVQHTSETNGGIYKFR